MHEKLENALAQRAFEQTGPQASINDQNASENAADKLRSDGDQDVTKTQREMLKNRYFQEFFNDYQTALHDTFGKLDDLAKHNITKNGNYYSCKDNYAPAMQKHMRDHNLYRQNEIKITTNIEKGKLNTLV